MTKMNDMQLSTCGTAHIFSPAAARLVHAITEAIVKDSTDRETDDVNESL